MKKHLPVILLVLLLWLPAGVFASDVEEVCSGYELQPDVVAALPRLAAISQNIVKDFCIGMLPREQLSKAILTFLAESDQEFNDIGITEAIFPFQAEVKEASTAVIIEGKQIANMSSLENPGEAGFMLYNPIKVSDLAACNKAVAKAADDNRIGRVDCITLMNDYVVIYRHAQYLVQYVMAAPVEKYLNLAEKQWDDFFSQSRSQTSIEMAFNSYFWRKGKKAGMFLPPPSKQWILLHPSIVVENVSEALDGSRVQEGVLVEIAGVNWWQRSKWYQLSGASLVTLYSDRAKVSDWGSGIALHFQNKFTVGAVKHGHSLGYFISLDVLELYKNKKTLIEEYIGKLKEQ